jgi:two-component system, NtrC family, response regulator AtoC
MAPISIAETHSPRVLVIDDDDSVRTVIRYLLESFGYTCETAPDGRSGLARFDEGGWNLVLTDLAMPDMSGWDVIEAIRHRAPTMPILVVTAFTDLTVLQRARESRVPVIAKPFRLEALKAAVAEALSPTKGDS